LSSVRDKTQLGSLTIRTGRVTDRVRLELFGELDLHSMALLEQQLSAAEGSGARRIVVDLSSLSFIDSSGLHVLLEAQRRSLEAGRTLSLVPGPPAVHRLFELTGLVAIFQFEPGQVDACSLVSSEHSGSQET
jgi:anti-sigma B factor antagonist